jgi:hypothetical protein
MAKRPSSPTPPAGTRSAARVSNPVAPAKRVPPAAAPIDPKPGAQADPRRSGKGRSGSRRGAALQVPAVLPQLDRDNRHRERINIPDSHKGATPMSDHKRNDRTPKRK